MSYVWEDTYGHENQYICALDIYLIIVLSSLYRIIMDFAMNIPGHGNNVFDGIKYTNTHDLKEQMELLGKLANNDAPKIGIITSE